MEETYIDCEEPVYVPRPNSLPPYNKRTIVNQQKFYKKKN